MVKVNIERIPLGQLVTSAYALIGKENKETNGSLLGEIIKGNGSRVYIVQGVQISQLAVKTPGKVYPDTNEERKIDKLLPKIGGFHSHTMSREKINGQRTMVPGKLRLSQSDLDYIKINYSSGIEVLVVINPTNILRKPSLNKFELSGSLEDNGKFYKIEIGAYYLDHNQRKRKAFLDIKRKYLEEYFF